MPTVYDIPIKILIAEIADILKKDYDQQISPLEWIQLVKAGVHKENPPEMEDWWFIRCASILRKLYSHDIIGINKLRNIYGGRKRRGPKPNKFKKASGAIIRNALKQLQNAGLVEIVDKRGRKLTPSGRSLLDRTATQLKLKLQREEIPALSKY